MSTRKCAWLALAPVLAVTWIAVAAAEPKARLGTYDKGGEQFFALSLSAGMPADANQANEVVVLFDTSASRPARSATTPW